MDILEEFLYQESVDEDDMQLQLAIESAQLALDRALLSCRMICEKSLLDEREAELKCVEEFGDVDTLERLYSEAQEANAEQKKGIFARAWEALKKFWHRIVAFFKGEKVQSSVGDINDNDEVTAPKGFVASVKKGVKWLGQHLSNGAKMLWSLIKGHPGITVATVMGTVTAACAFINRDKVKSDIEAIKQNKANGEKVIGKDIISILRDVFKLSERVDHEIDAAATVDASEEEKNIFVKVVNTIGSAIQTVVSTLLGLPRRMFGKKKAALPEPDGKGNEQPEGETPAAETDEGKGDTPKTKEQEKQEAIDDLKKEREAKEKPHYTFPSTSGKKIKEFADIVSSQINSHDAFMHLPVAKKKQLKDAVENYAKVATSTGVLYADLKKVFKSSGIILEATIEDKNIVGLSFTFENGEYAYVDFDTDVVTESEEEGDVDIDALFSEAFGEDVLNIEDEEEFQESSNDIDDLLSELFGESTSEDDEE